MKDSVEMHLYELSACELHNLIKGKEVSVEEVIASLLQRIKKVEERIKAFLSLYEKEALNEARKWDKKISRGEEVGPLAGEEPGKFQLLSGDEYLHL
ncbi:unnamed protein product [marine sediment metagenome]|uniref:Amidase domain-containing protein n=1 Tax=marine sediment metagenome TaxID=412755 RepID=X1RID0_9ZZZZ